MHRIEHHQKRKLIFEGVHFLIVDIFSNENLSHLTDIGFSGSKLGFDSEIILHYKDL